MRKQVCTAICALAVLALSVRAADAFKLDDEGYIRNWLKLGPIQLDDKAGSHDEDNQKDFFNKGVFVDAVKATPAEKDKLKAGDKELAWTAVKADDAIVSFDEQDNTMNIIKAYVIAEADVADAAISIGSDDSSCWNVNGTEVVRAYAGRAAEKDQDKSKSFALKKGQNVLTAAVINGGGPTGACCRIMDKDGKPVKGLTISLTPVK
ncbi:MAG TPA: hypothetical protein VGP72_24490 [Planctomycetota bacterium]|jgi:hypothetical protein